MAPLARRNLFHDKIRLIVTLAGIVIAVVLVVVQLGLLIGFSSATSTLIDHSGAQIWIASDSVRYLDTGTPFSQRKIYPVLATPGVENASKCIYQSMYWKLHDGSIQGVDLVGFDLDTGMAGPWDLIAGKVSDLRLPDAVIVDETYLDILGVHEVGETFEMSDRRARVVGITRGIRTFTGMPLVFTSFKNALSYTQMGEEQTTFILARLIPGADEAAIRQSLNTRLTNVHAYSQNQFARMTRLYWMLTTGAGLALVMAALLGLFVGMVVVSQTIYATTLEHLREFGTLKALGASNRYVYRVILEQAILSALMGYSLGMVVSVIVAHESARGGIDVVMPWQLNCGMFVLTSLMCVGAAIVSINKVMKVDPVMVFK